MTRMLRPLIALSLFFALPALAKTASVSAVSGNVKVGKEGAWRAATPGTEVPQSEFLLVPAGATVSVQLADGTKAEFRGKVLVPGRRLASEKAAGALLKFSRSLQKAAESVVGTDIVGTVPGAGKACSPEEIRLGTCKEGNKGAPIERDPNRIKNVTFMSEEEKKGSAALRAEMDFDKGDHYLARERSEAILADKTASAFEKRRASLVLANIRLDEGELTKALGLLNAVTAPPTDSENRSGFADYAKAYRVSGLVLRGELHQQLGDNKKATADFKAAIGEFQRTDKNYPLAAWRAHLFLATIALEANDKDAAKALVKDIPAQAPWQDESKPEPENLVQLREIKSAAEDLLKTAGVVM